MKNSNVCAIIVTFNRLNLLKGAIESIKNQTYRPDILIINNGSTDGSTEYLSTVQGINVINQENVGGAGGFYVGIKYAVENDYEFSWVMDDDIIALPNTLENLICAYKFLITKRENVGILCSTVINSEGYTVNNPVIDTEKLNPTYHPSWNKYLQDGLIGIKSASFVSVLIPTQISLEMGLPIRDFFIWGDDTEYTTRISKKYSCYLVGNSIIKHLRVGDKPIRLVELTDRNRIRMQVHSIRNEIYLNRKGYYNKKYTLVFILWHFVTLLRILKQGSWLKLKVFCKGIRQGLFFNPKIDFIKKTK